MVALSRKETPEAIRVRLSDSIQKAIAHPATQEKLIKAGVEPLGGGPKELQLAMQEEEKRVVQAARIAKLQSN